MSNNEKISAKCYAQMIAGGAVNLKEHVQEINDLNVFPIPDGDTGENMLLTMLGGARLKDSDEKSLSALSRKISDEMLLSARGNSGVILSQFFDGITKGFSKSQEADVSDLKEAFKLGVEQAYKSVMTPTEGTILTVIREATEYAVNSYVSTPLEFLDAFLTEAKSSLERTPELLPLLKEAGVVDSGGAGLVYIVEGMKMAMLGKEIGTALARKEKEEAQEIDLDAFDENSRLVYGYCTEILLRLQNCKVDVSSFSEGVIIDYLGTIGDSMVVVKSGSIVKVHVHTMTPHKVLEHLQQYGEFLKVKIENMSLQHNNTIKEEKKIDKKRKQYGVIAVATGEGVKQMFLDLGADVIVDGGQSMNPSAEDFLNAFEKANAETIFVFPNNGNIVLTAKQAGELYATSEICVIDSRTIGDGYASLSMLDTSLDKESIISELVSGMNGVVTAEISCSVRDASINNVDVRKGEYIGFVGKNILSSNESRVAVALQVLEKIGFDDYSVCILIGGSQSNSEETEAIEKNAHEKYPDKEIYIVDGGQDVYDYIMIIE